MLPADDVTGNAPDGFDDQSVGRVAFRLPARGTDERREPPQRPELRADFQAQRRMTAGTGLGGRGDANGPTCGRFASCEPDRVR